MTYAILTFISLVLFAVMVFCFLLSRDDPMDNDVRPPKEPQGTFPLRDCRPQTEYYPVETGAGKSPPVYVRREKE